MSRANGLAARLRQAAPHAVMLVAAGLLWWAASRIDVDTGGRIGPGVWPKAIVGFMALLCLYEIVKRVAFGASNTARGLVEGMEAQPEGERAREYPARLAGGIALVVAYVFGVQWLGFFVATALFLAVFPWIAGFRRPGLAAAIGVTGSLLLVVVFMRIAYISLPLGAGPFRAFSIALLRWLGVT